MEYTRADDKWSNTETDDKWINTKTDDKWSNSLLRENCMYIISSRAMCQYDIFYVKGDFDINEIFVSSLQTRHQGSSKIK